MNKSNDFLESLTTSYFSNTTLKLCQDLLYIVYIYTGAPRRSWRQIVYLVDGVDLTSDPRHANPTRLLRGRPDWRLWLIRIVLYSCSLAVYLNGGCLGCLLRRPWFDLVMGQYWSSGLVYSRVQKYLHTAKCLGTRLHQNQILLMYNTLTPINYHAYYSIRKSPKISK